MKTMKLLLVLAFIGLFGCSLQNVNLKPQMNAKNLKADMNLGNAWKNLKQVDQKL
jgi:hypothetical protein